MADVNHSSVAACRINKEHIKIPVLPSNNLAHIVRTIPGFSSCIALGEIIDEAGQERICYIKAFPPSNRGLINEIIHWILGTAVGISMAQAAWVVMAPSLFLKSAWPDQSWPDSEWPVFCLAEIPNHIPESAPHTDSPMLCADLRAWPGIWKVIAFHEWLANTDGNRGNLIRLGNAKYAAIDGADILGGRDWDAEKLGRIGYCYNKLAHMVGAAKNHTVTQGDAEKIKAVATNHLAALMSVEQELFGWLADLTSPNDAHAVLDFLKARASLQGTRWKKTSQEMAPA